MLGCPDDWVGHRRVCFYLSTAEGSWDWSQQQCSALGASLVVLRREWEMVSEGLLWVGGGEGGVLGSLGLAVGRGVGLAAAADRWLLSPLRRGFCRA